MSDAPDLNPDIAAAPDPGAYADRRVREALELARGNQTEALRILMARARRDEKLLFALTRPWLRGIAAHALERALKTPAPEPRPAQQVEARDMQDILAELERNFEKPGPIAGRRVDTRPPTSERHRAAIHAIAGAYRGPRGG